MNDKLKNFIVRTLSGAVMLAVVLGAILASEWSFIALMAVITLGGIWEFYNFAQKAGYQPMKLLGLFGGMMIFTIAISLFVLFATKDSTNDSLFAIIFGMAIVTLLLLVPLMFICELYRKSTTPIANIGSTIMGMLYVAMPLSLLILIPALLETSSGGWNPWIVLFYIFIIWANDVFAYLFGITLGRHRLFERISPKKSWEGFFGGLIGAMAMGYVASLVLDTEPVVWIGMALVAAIAGVFGDLVESLFKRSVDVKDSGNFIPGHGGWLDRFDALIFSAPFAFVYVLFVTLIL